MSALQADYFDGKSSRKHPVSVLVSDGKLKIVGRYVSAEFDARGVHRSLRVGNTPRWLYLPGGGALVTADNDAVDRMTRGAPYEELLHRWESRPVFAALAVGLVAGALWLLIDRGLPAAAEAIAERIPVEAEALLGEEALDGLERFALRPSQLPSARQHALREKLDAMARGAGEPTPYRLEFRASPALGPNAFALPAGIIVVTDDLVKLAKNDREVLAVLAHELGHVHHRHTMRRLLQSSATALVIAAVTGDIASTTSLAAAAPALLLQTRYSRDNEREADRYAIETMRRQGIDPRALATILSRLQGSSPRRGTIPTFLSTHPATEEREALARAAAGAEVAQQKEEEPEGKAEAKPAAAQPKEEEPEGQAEAKPVAAQPKLLAVDPVQREVIGLLEKGDHAELERVLGGYQRSFEQDPGGAARLENAFRSLRKAPRSAEPVLNEWVEKSPASYAARLARGTFFVYQGLEARGPAYARDTPQENFRAMRAYMGKARADLERSLTLTAKPYLSQWSLMTIARQSGNRPAATAHYLEAVKLAPDSIELRLAHMANLEPRWGGSYAEMQAFVAESRAQLKDPGAAARLAARIPANRAQERIDAKDFAGALLHYDEAIALDASAGLLCSRSYALSELKRAAEAFADVKLALSKDRDDRYCLQRAVYEAARAGDANEAIRVLNLVIEVDPNAEQAHRQRGWKYQQLGKWDAAFPDYLAAARLGDGWAQLMVGKLYWAGKGVKEDREEALVWLRKAAAHGDRDAKVSLEQALQQLGRK